VKPVRVLLCDDHDVLTEGLAAVLEARGLDVVAVVNRGADALAAVTRTEPDVVLMDYQLPDQDGVSVTKAIKGAHPDVQVVLLTSSTDDRVLVEALEAGASGYVTKHKGSAEVVDAVAAAAAGEVVVSPDMLARLLPRLSPQPHGQRLGSDLTPRESEVLGLMAEGSTNEEVADRLFISRNTVRNHVQNILTKLGAHSRLEAVVIATRTGLVRTR
jgi:DNA-binding NarL/FixJ family response regulator